MNASHNLPKIWILTPHFFRIPSDSVVGGEKPPLRRIERKHNSEGAES